MTGIAIPHDRTDQQPLRGYCLNPACLEDSADQRFEFDVEHDRFACPKCGGQDAPMVGLLVIIHLLIRDAKGPIKGQMARFRVACNTKRAYLATLTNMEAATGDPSIANCPGCRAEAKRLGIDRQRQGTHLLAPAKPVA